MKYLIYREVDHLETKNMFENIFPFDWGKCYFPKVSRCQSFRDWFSWETLLQGDWMDRSYNSSGVDLCLGIEQWGSNLKDSETVAWKARTYIESLEAQECCQPSTIAPYKQTSYYQGTDYAGGFAGLADSKGIIESWSEHNCHKSGYRIRRKMSVIWKNKGHIFLQYLL